MSHEFQLAKFTLFLRLYLENRLIDPNGIDSFINPFNDRENELNNEQKTKKLFLWILSTISMSSIP